MVNSDAPQEGANPCLKLHDYRVQSVRAGANGGNLFPRKDGLHMAKGHYSIRYDPDKLRRMIEEGKTAKEIIKEFKISPYTL